MNNKELDELLAAFLARNPVLADYLFSDQGIRLLYLDSQITALVHRHFTEIGVAVLSVHDSYIIDHMRVAELWAVMAEASRTVIGRELRTSIKLPAPRVCVRVGAAATGAHRVPAEKPVHWLHGSHVGL